VLELPITAPDLTITEAIVGDNALGALERSRRPDRCDKRFIFGYRQSPSGHVPSSAGCANLVSPAQEKWRNSSLALFVGRDTSGSDELSDL
jgi:hypothetical protein